MQRSRSHLPMQANHCFAASHADFNALVQEGLRRAPEERAQAVKDFWNWIVSRG